MKTEAEKLLAKLVAMPTITDDLGANDQAIAYIEAYLSERGMFVKRIEFENGHSAVIASTRADNGKNPAVLLSGHIDVVAGGEQLFTLRAEGDKLIGRGVYDMKFAIAGYMALVDKLKGRLEDYDFAIMIVSDEEPSAGDAGKSTKKLIAAGYKPGICILPDSTAPGWDIEERAKSAWRFKLTARGLTAHGSRPWEGDSASFKLVEALREVKQLFNGHGPQTDTLNIGIIKGGEAFNQIPDFMEAALEIRLLDVNTQHGLQKEIQRICIDHDVSYQQQSLELPTKIDLKNPLIQSYMDIVENLTGRRPQPFLSYGTTDAPFFLAAGVPCIISCPRGGGHHSENEWLDRKQFEQFVPIIQQYLDKHAAIAITSVDTEAALV